MLKLNTYIQYFEIKLILSINVSSLSLFENFNGTTGRDGFPGKRQKLVPGQTFGKEREIAVTSRDRSGLKFSGFGRAKIFLIGLGSGRAFLKSSKSGLGSGRAYEI